MIGIQQGGRGYALDDLRQLPAQVHRILHADEALAAYRGVHMGGIAGEQDAAIAVGGGLARHVGEAGDPGGIADPEIRAVGGGERSAEIAQGGLAGGCRLPFHQHHSRLSAFFHAADGMGQA